MIAHITGTLSEKSTQSVIVENGGIGYQVLVPLSTFYALPGEKETVSLFIHTYVREDALLLYGFQTILEKDLFLLLISVSGIGPKLAVSILSGIGPEDLLEAIAGGDAPRLQAIPGVGKKTADRIALELKDRAQRIAGKRPDQGPGAVGGPEQDVRDDAVSALLNLGYPAKAANRAVDGARAGLKTVTLEELIKEALRLLA